MPRTRRPQTPLLQNKHGELMEHGRSRQKFHRWRQRRDRQARLSRRINRAR